MKIGVAGCTGRVGKLIIEEIESGHWENLQVACGSARSIPEKGFEFLITQDPNILFQNSDCVIDFTLPEASVNHAQIAGAHKKPLIIGTTGLNADQENEIQNAAQNTPIVYAPNMSVGVTVLMSLVEEAAKKLDDAWDIEIFESHHTQKIDAPSGTAIGLGRAAAKGRNIELPEKINPDRSGKRAVGDIGFSVARGGDVIGEHTVYFYSQGERIELSHRATNRALFARGALKAAQWIKNKQAGLYSMRDVLDL